MSRPGMAWSAVILPACLLKSSDGTGDLASPNSEAASASVSGVAITVVASPKMEFISSRRTLAVSG
jgi:hypothetical protein